MPRILHIIDTAGPGGAETILTHLAGGLNALGWASRVLVPRDDWLYQRLGQMAVECRVIRNRGSASWRLLRSLVNEIKDFRPDLIHAHFLGSGVYGTLASHLSGGAPLICTFHGTPDVDPHDALLGLKARILSRPNNRIVYVSHHLRRHLEPILGVPPHLGEVIHNGVPFPDEEPANKSMTFEGVDPNARLIGAVGNIRPAKDYHTLLRAAHLVCLAHPNVHFVIVGGGQGGLFQDLLRLRRELGVEGRVHFLGFHPDVPSVLKALEIFVSSSATEGLPLASVEAMGMGKPVVLTNCGGVPEVVEDGRSGILVPVRNPQALAQGVLSLLGNPELARRLGAAARARAHAKFSLMSMLDRYTALYRTLLAG